METETRRELGDAAAERLDAGAIDALRALAAAEGEHDRQVGAQRERLAALVGGRRELRRPDLVHRDIVAERGHPKYPAAVGNDRAVMRFGAGVKNNRVLKLLRLRQAWLRALGRTPS